jgi:hypothetical protein
MTCSEDELFWVVSRISKDPRIEAVFYTITTSDHNAVLICVDEILVQKYLPFFMEKFSMAMGHESTT